MPELSRRRKFLVLAICCMSLFIVGLDDTIVNVALPSIRHDLHAPLSGLQWTIDAYTLVLASLLMLSGSTADRIGRRRTFQTGLVVFILGSMLCGMAPSLGWLVALPRAAGHRRVDAQPGRDVDHHQHLHRAAGSRARAIGVWAGVVGVSMALGPIVGGALVGSAGWRSIFWINVPVGAGRAACSPRCSSRSPARRAHAASTRSASCSSS